MIEDLDRVTAVPGMERSFKFDFDVTLVTPPTLICFETNPVIKRSPSPLLFA